MKISIYDAVYLLFFVGGLISLAVHYPLIAIPIYILIAVLVLVWRKNTNSKSKQYKSAFDSAFDGADCIPEYEQNWSYSYPSFLLTFPTKDAHDQYLRSERAGVFSKKIAELCEHVGSNKHPFDVERAVFITYEGESDT